MHIGLFRWLARLIGCHTLKGGERGSIKTKVTESEDELWAGRGRYAESGNARRKKGVQTRFGGEGFSPLLH